MIDSWVVIIGSWVYELVKHGHMGTRQTPRTPEQEAEIKAAAACMFGTRAPYVKLTPEQMEENREHNRRKEARKAAAALAVAAKVAKPSSSSSCIVCPPADSIDSWIARCESPAEKAFLYSIARRYKLVLRNGILKSDSHELRMQERIRGYRVDFVLDSKLIIEIDGAAYHSSYKAAVRDGRRDTVLRAAGYKVIRIGAARAMRSSDAAIADIEQLLG